MPVIVPFERVYTEERDREAACERVAGYFVQLGEATDAGDERERMDLLGRIGENQRMLGNIAEAVPLLQEAGHLARKLDDRPREIANMIRLATTLQYLDEHAAADALFRATLEMIDRSGSRDREDFARQHHGRCLAEMGRLDEAIAAFEAALAIRRAKGDAPLIASTECALARARSLRDGTPPPA